MGPLDPDDDWIGLAEGDSFASRKGNYGENENIFNFPIDFQHISNGDLFGESIGTWLAHIISCQFPFWRCSGILGLLVVEDDFSYPSLVWESAVLEFCSRLGQTQVSTQPINLAMN